MFAESSCVVRGQETKNRGGPKKVHFLCFHPHPRRELEIVMAGQKPVETGSIKHQSFRVVEDLKGQGALLPPRWASDRIRKNTKALDAPSATGLSELRKELQARQMYVAVSWTLNASL